MTSTMRKIRTPLYAVNDDSNSNGGDGGDGGDMKIRIEKIEGKVADITTDLAVIKSNYATRENVSNAKNAIILWVSSVVVFSHLLPYILEHIKIH